MVFSISEAGLAPAHHDEGDEFLSRQGSGFFDDGVKVVAMPCAIFPDHQHGQLAAMPLVGVAEQVAVQQASKVPEVGRGNLIVDPLPVHELLLGQREVDRVGNRIGKIKLLDG